MLRPALDDDIGAILRWRNHPAVRDVSRYRHEITPAEHAAWWARARADERARVLIYERDGIATGVVTFTEHDAGRRTAVWGFHLDLDGLDRRGDTLGAWFGVAHDALAYAFGDLGLDELHGEVLEHNTVVRRMNRRLGFIEGEPVGAEVDGRTIRTIPIRLRRTDRRTS